MKYVTLCVFIFFSLQSLTATLQEQKCFMQIRQSVNGYNESMLHVKVTDEKDSKVGVGYLFKRCPLAAEQDRLNFLTFLLGEKQNKCLWFPDYAFVAMQAYTQENKDLLEITYTSMKK